MNISKSKLFFLSLLSVVTLGVFVSFFQQNAQKSKAAQETVNVTFAPKNGSFATGETQNLQITISVNNPQTKLSAFDLYFKTTGDVTIQDVDRPIPLNAQYEFDATEIVKDVQNGEAHVSYVIINPTEKLPPQVIIPVTFVGNSAGAGTITLDTSRSRISGYAPGNSFGFGTVDQGSYTFEGDAVPTPTGTTNGGGDGITLHMRIKFQGIVKKPADQYNHMDVEVTLAKDGVKGTPISIPFVAGDDAIWEGTGTVSGAEAGANYSVYVKGPKHLAKRVCDINPTEDAGGTYRCSTGAMQLNAGDNDLDFSGIYLLAGDLPEQDGSQNGIVDAYDTSYVRLSLGLTDEKTLKTGDLNLDGLVDSQDYSLVIASLNIKYDEL